MVGGHRWEPRGADLLQFLRAYPGQGRTSSVDAGPVVVLPLASTAVARNVTVPPIGNGPIAPDHVEPPPLSVEDPGPEGPCQSSRTLVTSVSVTPTLTGTGVLQAPGEAVR